MDPKGESPVPRGEWRISVENQVKAEQWYLRNTPILVTRLTDDDGAAIEIFDFCPRFQRSGRMYRPVAFVRIMRPVAGAPRVRVHLTIGRAPVCTPLTNAQLVCRLLLEKKK